MPWKETCAMQERAKFIIDVLDGTYSMVELCDYYSISRKTGYKWLGRYHQSGIEALHDRSRAPYNHPQEMSLQVKQAILAIKQRLKFGQDLSEFIRDGSVILRYQQSGHFCKSKV